MARRRAEQTPGATETACDSFGTRQILPVATETGAEDGLVVADDYAVVEIIDPDTGEALGTGERGEVVVTHLRKEGVPLVRYRTGDLAELEERGGDLVRAHGNAFLDTSFAMSAAASDSMAFSPGSIPDSVFEEHSDSIMYGSDFPNLPHTYRDERAHLLDRDLPAAVYENLFRETAVRFLDG